MARLTTIRQENVKDEGLLPIIFEKGFSKKKLSKTELTKVALFEKGLANELSRTDTIEQSVTKIVKMALVCEFGAGLIAKSGAKAMIETISRGILGERALRRSALIIADRFANTKKQKTITVKKGRQGKISLNG
jgi:hypothetical protein